MFPIDKSGDNKNEKKPNMDCSFSIELDSKNNLKTVTMTNGSCDGVLVEGTIGDLVRAGFVEDIILEVIGEKGVLRVNLEPKELKKQAKAEVKK